MHVDSLLDAEGGATLKTALGALMKPSKNDDRSSGQRQADALVELCRRQISGKGLPDVAGQRPHLIIRASADTVAGLPGAPAGELVLGGTIPAETVRRIACDAAITRITGRGELEHEIRHASRTISASLRRKLEARDARCVFEGCDMLARWTGLQLPLLRALRRALWAGGHGSGLYRPSPPGARRRLAVEAPRRWRLRSDPAASWSHRPQPERLSESRRSRTGYPGRGSVSPRRRRLSGRSYRSPECRG